MFGVNENENLHFSVTANNLNDGLDEQLSGFISAPRYRFNNWRTKGSWDGGELQLANVIKLSQSNVADNGVLFNACASH